MPRSAASPISVALLEAYLDRRFPGWRDDAESEAEAAGSGSAADTGAMTDKEAYEILGLSPGAGEAEIRAAHRRLLKGVHPGPGRLDFPCRAYQSGEGLASQQTSITPIAVFAEFFVNIERSQGRHITVDPVAFDLVQAAMRGIRAGKADEARAIENPLPLTATPRCKATCWEGGRLCSCRLR